MTSPEECKNKNRRLYYVKCDAIKTTGDLNGKTKEFPFRAFTIQSKNIEVARDVVWRRLRKVKRIKRHMVILE